MKVYERKCSDFCYPEDMAKILKYLNERGRILVKESTIEDLYFDFSETHAAGWLIVNDGNLEEFEEWLSNVDI